MDTTEYMNRGKNFLSTLRRSVESSTAINWTVMGTMLGDLFYQTHQDGVALGSEVAVFHRQEKKALEGALTRLLEMGAEQAKKNAAKHKRMALQALETELTARFHTVVVDSLDLSGKKLDLLVGKFVTSLVELTEELKADEVIEEEA